jgi:PKD repeat protein
VTLINTVINRPTGCDDGSGSAVTTSPEITSAPLPGGTVGTTYDGTVTSTGSPDATYTVTSGALPPGLVLDGVTGGVTGTPTTPGTYTVTITASNGTAPDDSIESTIVITEAVPPGTPQVPGQPAVPAGDITRLPDTGFQGSTLAIVAGSLLGLGLLAGIASVIVRRRRRDQLGG